MLGAIIGDMVGSVYEFHPIKRKDFNMFNLRNRMTDDSLLTIGVAKVLMKHYPIKYDEESFKIFKNRALVNIINNSESIHSIGSKYFTISRLRDNIEDIL